MKKRFHVLSHTANLKLKVYGEDLQGLFRNALRGMFESIEPHYVKKAIPHIRHITISAHDVESLLVSFLAEALYLSDVHNEVYEKVSFDTFHSNELKATLYGMPVSSLKKEIKAITYHELEIKKVTDHFEAIIVFDL
jgi:SHS2 domain-containing protein